MHTNQLYRILVWLAWPPNQSTHTSALREREKEKRSQKSSASKGMGRGVEGARVNEEKTGHHHKNQHHSREMDNFVAAAVIIFNWSLSNVDA